jgi:SnoaL-like domain
MPKESTTPDPTELTRRLSRADIDESIAFYAPDAVFEIVGSGTFEGHAAIRESLVDWLGGYEAYDEEVAEVLHLGNGVVYASVLANCRPVGSHPSVRVSQTHGFVFVWSCGRVTYGALYGHIDEARAAAERLAEERG